jgi:molybdopterin-containing oxidoreductase family iron-sulfur binding subunit
MPLTRRGFLKSAVVTAFSCAVKHPLFPLSMGDSEKISIKPGVPADQRWAMVVDLKKCTSDTGCKDCIKICHKAHNVPEMGNAKEEIKWIWNAPQHKIFPEHEHLFKQADIEEDPVVVLCNHCENPPCIKVCPTGSTWKREDGIVMMDYHRCIGCRYCMAGCPYGSRSFNWRDPRPFLQTVNDNFPTRTKGVVEKCNFCVERLTERLLPACVEACPEKALMFGDLSNDESEIRRILELNHVIQRQPELGTKPHVYYII